MTLQRREISLATARDSALLGGLNIKYSFNSKQLKKKRLEPFKQTGGFCFAWTTTLAVDFENFLNSSLWASICLAPVLEKMLAIMQPPKKSAPQIATNNQKNEPMVDPKINQTGLLLDDWIDSDKKKTRNVTACRRKSADREILIVDSYPY